jgi:hypothetical protein
MQFPRRNVDFSNLGLIGRRREEKFLISSYRRRHQASIRVRPVCTFKTAVFSRPTIRVKVTHSL